MVNFNQLSICYLIHLIQLYRPLFLLSNKQIAHKWHFIIDIELSLHHITIAANSLFPASRRKLFHSIQLWLKN